MSAENAGPVAETMLVCERDGVKSHGLPRLLGFVRSVQVGWANGRAQPRIVEMHASMCVIDADNGFAQVCLTLTRDRLMDMARATGVAILLTRNAHHYAAVWPDIEPFADQGFITLSCVISKKRISHVGITHPDRGETATD